MTSILILLKKILSTKLIFNFLYYSIHCNIFFGFIQKNLFNYFRYKNYLFSVKKLNIPLSYYSSFFFKTYEINDRIILEKFLTKKNKCIIIGAGIGFTSVISYKITRNKVLCFEIDKKLKNILIKNFLLNNVDYKLIIKNLTFKRNNKKSYFTSGNNFLENNIFQKNKINEIKNIFYKNIPIKNFNTLIIDAEGYEHEIIKNINKLKNIEYLYFELHPKILNHHKQEEMFKLLRKYGFKRKFEFLDSYYFQKQQNII